MTAAELVKRITTDQAKVDTLRAKLRQKVVYYYIKGVISDSEATVLQLSYGAGLSLREAAESLGMSYEWVRKKAKVAVKKIGESEKRFKEALHDTATISD